MYEQPPKIEQERPYMEKHEKWLKEVKIVLQSFTAGMGGTIIGYEIMRSLVPEINNIPPFLIRAMGLSFTALLFSNWSRK